MQNSPVGKDILSICMLVPLLLRLFPGCSLSDVTSSGIAQTVKTQLMERIQTWKLEGLSVSRLFSKLESIVLRHDTNSQSKTDSESREDVEVRFKPGEYTQDPIRSKEQVTHGHQIQLPVHTMAYNLATNYDSLATEWPRHLATDYESLTSERLINLATLHNIYGHYDSLATDFPINIDTN
ncbi:hypothetical protein C0J50_11542 [Silurus asotus]|uniref:Uncharacterized protein n=1 Tax=Silurus asotus TaxID=30991 RepID=A0AAD5FF55_SILAS|nr:hypothetical protein C0J50_11542 [Silurus asotus]